EHRLELEPLRTVQRQQVDATAGGCAEALVQRRDERRHVALELLGEPNEPGEIGLTRLLPLAELLRRLLEPAETERHLADNVGGVTTADARQRLQHPPCRVAREKRRT